MSSSACGKGSGVVMPTRWNPTSRAYAFSSAVSTQPSVAQREYRHERLLRNLDLADPLHALLALGLLVEQLALAADVTAIALGQNVLAHGADRLAGNDLAANRRLQRDVEHLARNQLAQLVDEHAPLVINLVLVDDHAQRIDRLAVDQHVQLDQL